MQVGVPREIKTKEYRVGLMPASVRELVHHGHAVTVESGAGAGIGFEDAAYRAAGAEAVEGFRKVLFGLINPEDRDRIADVRPGPHRSD